MSRWLFVLVFAFSCLFLSLYPDARANDGEKTPYATMVTVDEIAADAIQAKERGLHQAEMKGLWAVLQNFSPDRAKKIFDALDAKDIHNMVESVNVENEREKAQRYQADVYIVFNKLRVDAAMKHEEGIVSKQGIDATGDGTVLILPLMNDGNGNLMLWQAGNTWRDALNTNALEHGKNKVIMPFGDPTDNLWVDQETALAGDVSVLQKVAERYGTRNVVIALATVARTGTGAKDMRYSVNVALRRAGNVEQYAPKKDYAGEAGEALSVALNQAAIETIGMLADSANQFAIFQENDASKTKAMVIRAEYSTPDKWLITRKFIENMDNVKLVDIGAVTPHYTQATIYFKGSAATIKNALQTQNITVKDTASFTTLIIP